MKPCRFIRLFAATKVYIGSHYNLRCLNITFGYFLSLRCQHMLADVGMTPPAEGRWTVFLLPARSGRWRSRTETHNRQTSIDDQEVVGDRSAGISNLARKRPRHPLPRLGITLVALGRHGRLRVSARSPLHQRSRRVRSANVDPSWMWSSTTNGNDNSLAGPDHSGNTMRHRSVSDCCASRHESKSRARPFGILCAAFACNDRGPESPEDLLMATRATSSQPKPRSAARRVHSSFDRVLMSNWSRVRA